MGEKTRETLFTKRAHDLQVTLKDATVRYYRSPSSTRVTTGFIKYIAIMDVSVAKLGDLRFVLLKVTASKQSSESQHSLPRSGQSSAVL